MNIGVRLETIAKLVKVGASVADIGTDHAYLPVYLVLNNVIPWAIAGDIATGPCQAARNTISMYGCSKKIEVRQGSGIEILKTGEVNTIIIAGMGANTMIDILEARPEIAEKADIILQPMTGAENLREWMATKGWEIIEEELALENEHLYDIIHARYSGEKMPIASKAVRLIGEYNITHKAPLLAKQFDKHKNSIKKLLNNMSHSEKAMESEKYKELSLLLKDLEALSHACGVK